MKNTILVSIIVPIYNICDFLPDCIESIINQTYKNLEIILVDDGSTDGSQNICDRYAKQDSRINVLHKSNGGLVSSRKLGLFHSHGSYCFNVDGDDYIYPNAIEDLVQNAITTNADIIQGGYAYDRNVFLPPNEITMLGNSINKDSIVYSWMKGCPIIDNAIWNKLYRTTFFRNLYMRVSDNMSLGEDLIFFIYLIYNSTHISSISSLVYYYRTREGSISHQKNIKALLDEGLLDHYLYTLIKEMSPDFDELCLNKWILQRKTTGMRPFLKSQNLHIQTYQWRNPQSLYMKKIILFGAGTIGKDIYIQLSSYQNIDILSWVDFNYTNIDYEIYKIENPDVIKAFDFDKILVLVQSQIHKNQIYDYLHHQIHIPNDKIILWEPTD